MWISVKQYSKKKHITTTAVYKKIKAGTLRWRMKNEQKQVFYSPDEVQTIEPISEAEEQPTAEDEAYTEAITQKTQIDNELKKWKLENLKTDNQLKLQRSKEYIEDQRREFAEDVFECFTNSFSDVKSLFISLKLNKQQNLKLKQVFNRSIQSFRENLLAYLQKRKKEEKTQDETAK